MILIYIKDFHLTMTLISIAYISTRPNQNEKRIELFRWVWATCRDSSRYTFSIYYYL